VRPCSNPRVLSRIVDLAYRTRVARPVRVPGVAVFSVGGLTWGGAGKTPVAMALAAHARDAGESVAVVLRGYGGRGSRAGLLVSDGTRVLADAREAGDEAVLHALRLPSVLVRIGADRVDAVRRARADGARLVVVDDGFQHRRLARDVDVVCVGADGWRREHDAALSRADAVIAIDGAPVPPTDRPISFARTVVRGLVRGPRLEPAGDAASLAGRRVALACAIAHPWRFERTVHALGAVVTSVRSRRDHQPLSAADLTAPADAELVLVTEKDLVKVDARRTDVRALRIDVVPPCHALFGLGGDLHVPPRPAARAAGSGWLGTQHVVLARDFGARAPAR